MTDCNVILQSMPYNVGQSTSKAECLILRQVKVLALFIILNAQMINSSVKYIIRH